MKTRLALVAIISAAISAVAAPTPSFAAGNNNNATIDGVSSEPVAQSPGCLYGEFCMYTETGARGRIFRMYRCGTYTMRNWNGIGSWTNNNTDDAKAYLKNSSGRIVLTAYAGQHYGEYNFTPIWYVTPC